MTAGAASDKERAEAMLKAVREQDANQVHFLLSEGANPNAVNIWQESPLHAAAYAGNLDIAAMLVKAGADFTAKDARGLTAMEVATRRSQETFSFAREPYADVAAYLKAEMDAATQRAETERLQKETVASDLAALKARNPKRFRLKP